MGIDIFVYAERQQPDGSWSLASGMEKNPFFFDGDENCSDEGGLLEPEFVPAQAFDIGRNYNLFAVLANIKNGSQTAEGEVFEYISLPRGLPSDLSPELREYAASWGDDFFAATWLILEEVLNFSWKKNVILREAMVDKRAAPLFGYKQPLISGHEWQSPKQPRVGFPFDEWPKNVEISTSTWKRDGVTVRWQETYEYITGYFLETLQPLLNLGDPKDTRLVFWFAA